MSRKYPLDPLLKLRERQVEAATEKLAGAVGARQAAERERIAAEGRRASAEERAKTLREEEREALEKGELRAGDLHRAQAWELGVQQEQRRLAQQVAAATQGETTAREAEREAQHDLAAREADAEVVEKDKERFDAKRRATELAKEEEAAAEAHGAKNRDEWRPKR